MRHEWDQNLKEVEIRFREGLRGSDEEIEQLKERERKREEEYRKRFEEMEAIVKNLPIALANNSH